MNILIVNGDATTAQRLQVRLGQAGHQVERHPTLARADEHDLSISGVDACHLEIVDDLIARVASLDLQSVAGCPFVVRFGEHHYALTLPSCRNLLGAISRHLVQVCGSRLPTSSQDHFNTALCEALQNALIHGNLEISSELRDQGDWEAYETLIRARLTQHSYARRAIRIEADCGDARLTIKIEDDGPGFDPAALPDPLEPDALLRSSGRGITMIRFAMDEVSWNARGNRIEMTKYLDAA